MSSSTIRHYRSSENIAVPPPKPQLNMIEVKAYIHAFFKGTPKAPSGSAPGYDWWRFFTRYNEIEIGYVLTKSQLKQMQPFCEMNKDLEISPDEIIRLVAIVRKEENYNSRTSFRSNNTADSSSISTPYSRIKRERDSLQRQLQQYDTKILNLSKQHAGRFSQLQADIGKLTSKVEEQRSIINQQTLKERERLDTISKLKNIIKQLQHQESNKSKQRREEEFGDLDKTHRITVANFEAIKSELYHVRSKSNDLEKELHLKAEQNDVYVSRIREELEAQRQENIRLMELLDRRKFDRDEAIVTEQRDISPTKSDLATVQKERDSYHGNFRITKDKSVPGVYTVNRTHTQSYRKLSHKIDPQHVSTHNSSSTTPYPKLLIIFSTFLCMCILYHFLCTFAPDAPGCTSHSIFVYIDEFLYKYK